MERELVKWGWVEVEWGMGTPRREKRARIWEGIASQYYNVPASLLQVVNS